MSHESYGNVFHLKMPLLCKWTRMLMQQAKTWSEKRICSYIRRMGRSCDRHTSKSPTNTISMYSLDRVSLNLLYETVCERVWPPPPAGSGSDRAVEAHGQIPHRSPLPAQEGQCPVHMLLMLCMWCEMQLLLGRCSLEYMGITAGCNSLTNGHASLPFAKEKTLFHCSAKEHIESI